MVTLKFYLKSERIGTKVCTINPSGQSENAMVLDRLNPEKVLDKGMQPNDID